MSGNRGGGRVLLSWSNTVGATAYVLRYRAVGQTAWQEVTVYGTAYSVEGLVDGGYEYGVSGLCELGRQGVFSGSSGLLVAKGEVSAVPLATLLSGGVSGSGSAVGTPAAPAEAVPTAQEQALSRLLNPGSVLINTSGLKTEEMVTAVLAKLDSLSRNPPPCAGIVSSDPSCVSLTADYSGYAAKGSLSVGDVLYVNTYQLILTQVSGGGGQFTGSGVVVFPYLNKALFAVDFNGIKVVGSPTQPGGCVTGGDVVVVGSNAGRLDGEVQARLAALYAKAQAGAQQDEFVGKLDEALAALSQQSKAMQERLGRGGTLGKDDYQSLTKSLKAIQKFLKAFDGDLETVFGKDSPQLAAARQSLGALQALADGCVACADEQANAPATPAKGSGPHWAEPVFACDAQTMLANADKIPGDWQQISNTTTALLAPIPQLLPCLSTVSNLDPTLRTFLAPDGGTITLLDTDQVVDVKFDIPYPKGTLLGFKRNGMTYAAYITPKSPQHFQGYVDVRQWSPQSPFLQSTPYPLNQAINALVVETATTTISIGVAQYTPDLAFQAGTIPQTLPYKATADAVSACSRTSGQSSTVADYGGDAGRQKLKQQLKDYGLSDVGVSITDKGGKTWYITSEGVSATGSATKPTTFKVTERSDGSDVGIEATFKPDGTCATCAPKAKAVFDQALADAKAEHGGKLTLAGEYVKAQNQLTGLQGIAGGDKGIEYQRMDLGTFLSSVAKAYNEVLEYTKVPKSVWVRGEPFPVKDHTAVLSGVIDGARDEVAGKADLVGLALTVVANPKQTGQQLKGFVTNLDWGKTGDLVAGVASGMVGYNADEFNDSRPEYPLHATGYMGGTLTMQAATGGLALLALVNDTPKKLNRAQEILKDWFVDLSKVRKINGRFPINSQMYAGKKYSFDFNANPPLQVGKPNLSAAEKARLDALHAKYPSGVDFDEYGFARFEPYTVEVKGKKAEVKVQTKGNRDSDFSKADAEMGIDDTYRIDNGLVWHHVEDKETLILVPKDIHGQVKHTGGIGVYKNDLSIDD